MYVPPCVNLRFLPSLRQGHGVSLYSDRVVDVVEVGLLLRALHGRALLADPLQGAFLVVDPAQDLPVDLVNRHLKRMPENEI